jgi:hypothetical protein
MNRDHHDIDKLLQANVEGQLSRIDWDRFGGDVAKRLATAELRRRSHSRYFGPLAVAAGFVLAAGVLVAVVVTRHGPTTTATVVFGSERGARCDVTLIDSEVAQAEEPRQSSWCIVVGHELPSKESGRQSDRMNIACLF